MKLSTDIEGVTKVRVYGRIGQMAIEYDAPRRTDVLGAHYARRWFLPTPLRAVFVVAGYMAFLPAAITAPLKTLSKFLIVMAMSAIGLNTDIVKLVRTGGKPIALGACCWGRHRLRELGYAARYRHLVRKTRRRVCGDAFWRGHNLV